jgi:hypothetical protein
LILPQPRHRGHSAFERIKIPWADLLGMKKGKDGELAEKDDPFHEKPNAVSNGEPFKLLLKVPPNLRSGTRSGQRSTRRMWSPVRFSRGVGATYSLRIQHHQTLDWSRSTR